MVLAMMVSMGLGMVTTKVAKIGWPMDIGDGVLGMDLYSLATCGPAWPAYRRRGWRWVVMGCEKWQRGGGLGVKKAMEMGKPMEESIGGEQLPWYPDINITFSWQYPFSYIFPPFLSVLPFSRDSPSVLVPCWWNEKKKNRKRIEKKEYIKSK